MTDPKLIVGGKTEIENAFNQAQKEVQAENAKKNVEKFKKKLTELENAKLVVRNIEREIEDLKVEMSS